MKINVCNMVFIVNKQRLFMLVKIKMIIKNLWYNMM